MRFFSSFWGAFFCCWRWRWGTSFFKQKLLSPMCNIGTWQNPYTRFEIHVLILSMFEFEFFTYLNFRVSLSPWVSVYIDFIHVCILVCLLYTNAWKNELQQFFLLFTVWVLNISFLLSLHNYMYTKLFAFIFLCLEIRTHTTSLGSFVRLSFFLCLLLCFPVFDSFPHLYVGYTIITVAFLGSIEWTLIHTHTHKKRATSMCVCTTHTQLQMSKSMLLLLFFSFLHSLRSYLVSMTTIRIYAAE